jgi:hypothetical protein
MRPSQTRTNRAANLAALRAEFARVLVLTLTLAGGATAAACATGCNTQRKQDCDKFLPVMAPIQEGMPTADTVDRVHDSVAALTIDDQPLREYATNYKNTLTVLSNTLKLKAGAGPDGPPDGTEDVIKKNLKDARTDFDDISRYCAP